MSILLTEQTILGDILHQWTIQEYDHHQRGTFWYIFMISIGIAIVVYSLITNNFLFSLIIILFAIIIFLQAKQTPPQVQFAITELGIVIGGRFYSYSEFTSFYVVYQLPRIKTLFLETTSFYKPLIRVPLLDENPMDIRLALREFLPEDIEKEEEPLSDAVARNWKIH